MREAAPLVSQNAMVRILGGKLGNAAPERSALLHALEDKVDAVGVLLLHAAQGGQDVILFAGSFFGPFHRDFVVAGVGLDPAPVLVGTLAEDFFTHHRDTQNLSEEVDHLLRPGQTAQIPVDDDAVETVIDKGQQIPEQLGESFHVHVLYSMGRRDVGRRTIKRGPSGKLLDGKGFRLADEVRYIQDKAAEHDGRIVKIGQLILFSTDTGDAWLLDVTDQLAARLAGDGDSETIHLEETDTSFAIEWKGRYRIEGSAFTYADRNTGRVTTILGYPTQKIAQAG